MNGCIPMPLRNAYEGAPLLSREDQSLGQSTRTSIPVVAGGYSDHVLTPSLTVHRAAIGSVISPRGCAQGADSVQLAIGWHVNEGELPAVVARKLPLIARVRWGQGAASFAAEVDVRVGMQVTVPASAVDVSFFAEAIDAADVVSHLPTFAVSAAIVNGTRSGRTLASRTYPPHSIAAAAQIIYPVPPFASTMYLVTPSGLAGSLVVVELGGPLATDEIFRVTDGAVLQGSMITGGLQLSGHTRYVGVENDAAGAVRYSLGFGLML